MCHVFESERRHFLPYQVGILFLAMLNLGGQVGMVSSLFAAISPGGNFRRADRIETDSLSRDFDRVGRSLVLADRAET